MLRAPVPIPHRHPGTSNQVGKSVKSLVLGLNYRLANTDGDFVRELFVQEALECGYEFRNVVTAPRVTCYVVSTCAGPARVDFAHP